MRRVFQATHGVAALSGIMHQTILIRCARKFATFSSIAGDRDTSRKVAIGIESATNALRQGKELNEVQHSMTKLPTWNQLIDAVSDEVEHYNKYHQHDSLPKRPMANITPC